MKQSRNKCVLATAVLLIAALPSTQAQFCESEYGLNIDPENTECLGDVSSTFEADDVLTLPLPGPSASAQKSFVRQPLTFERNDGQTDSEVAFVSRGRGYTLFLAKDENVLVLQKPQPHWDSIATEKSEWMQKHAVALERECEPSAVSEQRHILRMRLLGANPQPAIEGEELLRAKANYFIGNQPSHWRTNIPTFGEVRYREVYPGIDLVYYGNDGQLEYDFVVGPGKDPSRIAMEFEGADDMRVDERGDLLLKVGDREVRWQKPFIYQQVDGARHEIVGTYRLRGGTGASIELAAYDPALPLVIDPRLVYSTYLGGSAADGGKDLAVDSQGNAYLAGFTESVDFPTKASIIGTAPGGSYGNFSTDMFVAKFSPAGELLYSTYLGGSGDEWSDDVNIAVTDTGECYVAGTTSSQDFPLVNPLQDTYGGGDFDVFVASLNADGSALVFSTYLGGEAWDGVGDIAIGANRDIFVVGYTRSLAFPTRNAFQPFLSPPSNGSQFSDSFVTRIEAGGKSILSSTYFGRSATIEKASGVAVDPDGNAYLAVWVDDVSLNGNQYLVAKISPDGRTRVFERRWPATMAQQYMFPPYIALVSSNRVAVAGSVAVPNLQAVNQPDASISLGQMESYIALFSATNGSYLSAVYFGGSGSDYVSGLKVDASADVIVVGTTHPGSEASGFPVTDPVASGPDPGKSIDVFVTKLHPPNLTLVSSTLLGGSGDDFTSSLAVDTFGNVLVTGYTGGQFPMVNAFQPNSAAGFGTPSF